MTSMEVNGLLATWSRFIKRPPKIWQGELLRWWVLLRSVQSERLLGVQEKKAKEMEELAATLAELGIQNVAPEQEDAGQTESSKRKKKKDKGKGAEKVAKPEDGS